MKAFQELMIEGRITWASDARAWIAQPGDIVAALTREGFEEFKADAASRGRGAAPTGGLWQGLDARTGAVASAVWVSNDSVRSERADRAVVYVDIDGAPVNEQHTGG
jgi:hypothetical protein